MIKLSLTMPLLVNWWGMGRQYWNMPMAETSSMVFFSLLPSFVYLDLKEEEANILSKDCLRDQSTLELHHSI
jgi:hypothetical protein